MLMQHVVKWSPENAASVDSVSQDEWNYDESAISAFLETTYEQTSSNPSFHTLYVLAAGAMMSEDPNIGLAVLCSYDYLIYFHTCLCAHHSDQDMTQHASYQYLLRKLK